MKKKVLIGLLSLVLIVVLTVIIFKVVNGENTEEPSVSETPATTPVSVPAPAPETTTQPQSPMPDKEDVDETIDPETGAISTSAFVYKVKNGEYEWPYTGIVVTVWGTVKSLEDLYSQMGTVQGSWAGYNVEFEPNQGFVVSWAFPKWDYDFERVKNLQSGQKIVVSGKLMRIGESTKKITMQNCKLIKVY